MIVPATQLRILLLASTAVLATAGDKGPYNGKWQVHESVAGFENTGTCTFTQNGSDLSGSCGSEQGPLALTGKVEDKKATWSLKAEFNGSPLTVRFTGTMDAQKKITGTVAVEEFAVEGEFTATPAE